MSSDYDSTEFIDGDFEPQRSSLGGQRAGGAGRAPTRAEVDAQVAEKQQKLAELKRAQEELERERATLEETRRRQAEFQTGREEMVRNLTRGLGLLEEAEFVARRDAQEMAKANAGLKEALTKVQAIHEETWTQETFKVELTRALTVLENARMEWNAARLKFPVLANPQAPEGASASHPEVPGGPMPAGMNFGQAFRLGLAFTLPLAVVLVLLFAVVLALVWRH